MQGRERMREQELKIERLDIIQIEKLKIEKQDIIQIERRKTWYGKKQPSILLR